MDSSRKPSISYSGAEVYPPTIDKEDQIDIFGTLLLLNPYEATNSTLNNPLRSTSTNAPSTPTAVRSSPAVVPSPGSAKFYCEACRKSFNSEATWLTHQNSSKHLQNLKSQKKNMKTPKKANSEAKKKPEVFSPGRPTTSPQVAEALLNEKQAKKVADSNPVMAATVFWNVSKVLWANCHVRDTFNTLENLVHHLEKTIEIAQEQQDEALVALLPKLAATLYLARMALARLIYHYSNDKYSACTLARLAVEERFGLPTSQLKDIIQVAGSHSVEKLYKRCTQILEESNSSIKITKDPNLTLSDILSEVAGFYCNHIDRSSEETSEQSRSLQHCSIVFYILSSIIYTKQDRIPDHLKTLRFLEQIYHHLEKPWYACDIMMLSIKLKMKLFQAADEAAPQPKPDFSTLWWAICNALLISVEIRDFVRIIEIQDICESILTAQGLDTIPYTDIKFLLTAARSIQVHDTTWLQFSAPFEIELFQLIAQEIECTLDPKDFIFSMNLTRHEERRRWAQRLRSLIL
ncbi:hypothetical protein K493DRAFT_332590 [Basidiobolus meristosporus CBS 931.73]|uniref:C2H2-type domain-containing protein n=1 Tax=Basidiobolus meristosporus CBS 931.73 TaxID=1314790 RepID=A0A1Y1ZC75_9FUNG|nr:hypothetical protein K493DRAFT_332590 [Basidiobolus meristosporus CBS 931.73]|eukprot:ORY07848.1 hypothetical protein K493DRAFT_332590 [Basidiobolus meristosporus CBS 931.73]